MSKPLVHTPEGVRDIYGEEYLRKLMVEEKLHHSLRSYGYQDIQTPTFEFFDVFSREIGTTPSRELYKFFDKEGNTLVLRRRPPGLQFQQNLFRRPGAAGAESHTPGLL